MDGKTFVNLDILSNRTHFSYGEVYQGEWQGTTIAVKKFHAWDDKSWQREYEVINKSLKSVILTLYLDLWFIDSQKYSGFHCS